MKGVFVRVEKSEMKEIVSEMLAASTNIVQLSSGTSELKKLRTSRIKMQEVFMSGIEYIDLEVERIKSFLPSIEMPGIKFTPGKPSASIRPLSARRGRYGSELERIRQRLEELKKK